MQLLIWDFDGTLAYRPGLWSGAVLDVLNAHIPGHTITREQLRPHLSRGFPWHTPEQPHEPNLAAEVWWARLHPVFAGALTANGIAVEQAATLAAAVRSAYCDPAGWALYPEAMATLTALGQAGWTQVILSNHVPELPGLVRHLGLEPCITAIFNSAVTGYAKPHPAAFQHVLAALPGVTRAWMIGDNPVADIAGAAAVGLPGILVRSRAATMAHCCDDLSQIERIVTSSVGA